MLHEYGGSTVLELQGRLLARQASAVISKLTLIASDVIDAYEGLFFDVRRHLDARDWILANAICQSSPGGVDPERGRVFKTFAFRHGPLMLERVRPYLVDGEDPFSPLADLSTPTARLEQRIRIAVACELLENDSGNCRILQKINALMFARDKNRLIDQLETPESGRNYASLIANALTSAQLEHHDDDEIERLEPTLHAAKRTA